MFPYVPILPPKTRFPISKNDDDGPDVDEGPSSKVELKPIKVISFELNESIDHTNYFINIGQIFQKTFMFGHYQAHECAIV